MIVLQFEGCQVRLRLITWSNRPSDNPCAPALHLILTFSSVTGIVTGELWKYSGRAVDEEEAALGQSEVLLQPPVRILGIRSIVVISLLCALFGSHIDLLRLFS
ncbi:hypothetical protein RvY_15209 [Ramazzottius varieornatus]|uniref:Uncharacterized protein n=1 Tax=Ramazzottius varieornatus TaxID=947166 RepID=A0A1D1VYW1_RAMVA|nr:hypothetical protein RvY_15209 [Ramazzottius varieornatus]